MFLHQLEKEQHMNSIGSQTNNMREGRKTCFVKVKVVADMPKGHNKVQKPALM
jgi:ornithine cyclodeaminase/alanine dehydrogenase-like protein (mu-crystallin family)